VRRACLAQFQACISEAIYFDKKNLGKAIEQALQLAISMAKQRPTLRFNIVNDEGSQRVKFDKETMDSPSNSEL
jgi:hypothetical protein